MSAKLELRWLKVDELTGAARRFAEFSKEDIREQGKLEDFDIDKYEDAVKLVLGKLDNSLLLKKLFNPDLDNQTNKEAQSETTKVESEIVATEKAVPKVEEKSEIKEETKGDSHAD